MSGVPTSSLKIRIFVNTVSFIDLSRFRVGDGVAQITGGWSYKACDIAIMYGLANPPRTSMQGQLRNAIHREHRGPIIVIESSIFGRAFLHREPSLMQMLLRRSARPQQHHPYFRVGVGGALGDDADFGAHHSPSDRWNLMCDRLSLNVRPYRSEGLPIVVLGQLAKDASLRGMDINWWLIDSVLKIRRITDRPILVRLHPSMPTRDSAVIRRNLAVVNGVSLSHVGQDLRQDLDNAWCCVTYSSGAAVDALIAGIPPICMSPASLAYKICSKDIQEAECPLMPHRDQFFYDIAYSQWSLGEMADGTAWRHIWPVLDQRSA